MTEETDISGDEFDEIEDIDPDSSSEEVDDSSENSVSEGEEKGRKMVAPELWAQAEDDFVHGKRRASQIAADLGVSISAVSQRFKKKTLYFGEKALAKATTPVAPPAPPTPEQKRSAQIEKVREQSYLAITAFQNEIVNIFRDAKAGGHKMDAVKEEFRSMRIGIAGLREAMQGRLDALEADKIVDTERYAIHIEDLGEDVEAAMKAAQPSLAEEEDGLIVEEE
jgi:hypothetical protein